MEHSSIHTLVAPILGFTNEGRWDVPRVSVGCLTLYRGAEGEVSLVCLGSVVTPDTMVSPDSRDRRASSLFQARLSHNSYCINLCESLLLVIGETNIAKWPRGKFGVGHERRSSFCPLLCINH